MPEQNDDNSEWTGRERRSGDDRRQNNDRREEIRFEPGKSNRRKNRGRRKDDNDLWHTNNG